MKTHIKDILIEILGNLDAGQRIRKTHIFSVLNKLNLDGKTILDAGSGFGDYIFSLARGYPSNQFIGIEMDPEKIKQCILKRDRQNIRNIEFIQDNLENFSGTNAFDVIYSIDVLEHIVNDRTVFMSFYRALKRGGILLIHVPNINQKRHFKQFETWEQNDHVRNGYEREELVNKLNKLGFNDIKTKSTCGWAESLAWEIQKLFEIWFSHRIGQIISFPLVLYLTFIDRHINKTSGNGILLMARK
ncbi:MAG: class I SAM-dependent methyltransferase [Elusimicrobiota bacterium]